MVVWVKTTTELNDMKLVPVLLQGKGQYRRFHLHGELGAEERFPVPLTILPSEWFDHLMACLMIEPRFVSTMLCLSNGYGPSTSGLHGVDRGVTL